MGAFLRRQLLVAAAALHAHRAPAAVRIADFATVAHDAAVGWAPLPGCANKSAAECRNYSYLGSSRGGFGGPAMISVEDVVLVTFDGHKYNCADFPGQVRPRSQPHTTTTHTSPCSHGPRTAGPARHPVPEEHRQGGDVGALRRRPGAGQHRGDLGRQLRRAADHVRVRRQRPRVRQRDESNQRAVHIRA